MDKLTTEQRRKNMQANKSTGTKPELLLAKFLFARGHRYRKNDKTVFGKPDLTFKKLKIAVFVDGEFWHGKDWEANKDRHKQNREFWIKKIERNIERDKEVNQKLLENGWTTLRFWGKDIEKDLLNCAIEVENAIKEAKMDLKEKISLEEIKVKQFSVRIVEPECNKEAVLTHYMHNSKNGVSKFYKKDAVEFTKEILQYKYPEETITNLVAEEALQYGIFDTFEVPFPPTENPKFKFIDLFAGIGGFRLAMQNLGGKCVFTSEWDKEAKKTYKANFGETPFGDITKEETKAYIPDGFDLGIFLSGLAFRSNLFGEKKSPKRIFTSIPNVQAA
jgi:DNA (cytosine-5)-methyltransferase 1